MMKFIASDLDAAKMLNDMGAHILVDFNGYLSGTRMVRDLAMLLLQLHRSLEQQVGVLGVLMSASAYLPLDPTWPLERRKFMLEDATCVQLILHASELESCFYCCGDGTVLELDDARSMAFVPSAAPAAEAVCATRNQA